MASAQLFQHHPRTALATSYQGGETALLEAMLPLVDYIEITPDTIAELTDDESHPNPNTVAELKDIGSGAQLIAHGVGLSIGSHDGYSERYLGLLDQLFSQFDIAWHSEHLAYTTVDGESLGTMLALPRTNEMLDLVSERVLRIQQRYGVPFLLENVVHILPDYDGEYSDAAFLNQLAANTGCGLILDAYNLECDAFNYGFDIQAFLRELNFGNVREIHIAGGVRHRGFQLDVHSRATADSTLQLANMVLAHAPNVRTVTYEFLREAIPYLGQSGICTELARIGKFFQS
jgi:uncharacterized protein (UPF0276 family)